MGLLYYRKKYSRKNFKYEKRNILLFCQKLKNFNPLKMGEKIYDKKRIF